jgi:hypothetical protein
VKIMSAWKHSNYWTATSYGDYRKYVQVQAPRFRNRADLDCADMSLTLLIEFATAGGLPVTFWDNDQIRYCSKGTRQSPTSYLSAHRTLSWSNQAEFAAAVRRRIGAKSLLLQNTAANPHGPEPGDLMAATDHTALVYQVYPPGVPHPQASNRAIPVFPGNDKAQKELHQTEYFREVATTASMHLDYLNHRGWGKQKAELIYFADATTMVKDGFRFCMYKPGVLDNWVDWTGDGDPPR